MLEKFKMPDLGAMRQDIQDMKAMLNLLEGMTVTDQIEYRLLDEISQAAAKKRGSISAAMLEAAVDDETQALCMALYKYLRMLQLRPEIKECYDELDTLNQITDEIVIPESRLAWTLLSVRAKQELADADRLLMRMEANQMTAQVGLLEKRRADALNPMLHKAIAYIRENTKECLALLESIGYEVNGTQSE